MSSGLLSPTACLRTAFIGSSSPVQIYVSDECKIFFCQRQHHVFHVCSCCTLDVAGISISHVNSNYLMFLGACSFLLYLAPTYNAAPNHLAVSYAELQTQTFPTYFLFPGVIRDAVAAGLCCVLSHRRAQKEGCSTMGETRKRETLEMINMDTSIQNAYTNVLV